VLAQATTYTIHPGVAAAERVEVVEGVRFRALFERLPTTAPDGDAALAAVWQLVAEEKMRGDGERPRRETVLASLPPAVRTAFELDGEDFSAATDEGLRGEIEPVLARLEENGWMLTDAAQHIWAGERLTNADYLDVGEGLVTAPLD